MEQGREEGGSKSRESGIKPDKNARQRAKDGMKGSDTEPERGLPRNVEEPSGASGPWKGSEAGAVSDFHGENGCDRAIIWGGRQAVPLPPSLSHRIAVTGRWVKWVHAPD